MDEFIRFLVVSNVSLFIVWISYKLVLKRSTFHGLNRAYLLVGSVLSMIVPFVPTSWETADTYIGLKLPTIEVGSAIIPVVHSALSVDVLSLLYTLGALVALWFFIRSVSSLMKLVRQAHSEILMGEWVVRSDKAGPFSFLSIVHLPQKLSSNNLETILQHELAHVKLGHSYDVLWLSFLRILFWFNPLLTFFMRTLQEIHEYQADALTHISSTKEHYVKVQLDQLFQLPSELSFANSFYNSINLKKRVNMIYSEKTSKWGTARYLVAVPLIATIGLLAACTETDVPTPPPPPAPPAAPASPVASPSNANMVYKKADVMPEYPGGMQALMAYMGESIKYPKAASEAGVEGKVFVQFVVGIDGKVSLIEVVKSVHEDLDAEATRVISEMPDWKPGVKDGEKVNVQMVLPISYKLE